MLSLGALMCLLFLPTAQVLQSGLTQEVPRVLTNSTKVPTGHRAALGLLSPLHAHIWLPS